MENAVEALKMAFGVLIFVLALSMSISCFSQANSAVQSIVMSRDRETEYTYVNQTQGLTRIVGLETVIPTIYRAYTENIEIYFFTSTGDKLPLYYKDDGYGNIVKDEGGNEVEINYIDSSKENYSNTRVAIKHLDDIIGLGKVNGGESVYYDQFIYDYGIYQEFKNNNYQFIEQLGEYEVGEGASKSTKRVITYTIYEDTP